MKLRSYQEDAVEALFEYFRTGTGNPVVVMPTGTGKSLVIAEFIRRALKQYPATRILMLTHVQELIEQNHAKILKVWPNAPVGIYSDGLKRKEIHQPVTFAGIQSIANVAHLFGHIDLVVIDECDLVSPKDETTYKKFLTALWFANPFLKVIGLTATPFRMGQGMIVEPGGVFTDICINMSTLEGFNWFLAEGYLKPLVPKGTRTVLDTTGIALGANGDFKESAMQAAFDKDALTRACVAEMLAMASDREHWLVFGSGVTHSEHIATELQNNGIETACVHSKVSREFRKDSISDFKHGRIRALVGNGIFTTGFDYPGIDFLGIMRGTTSARLWVQILGRGTRPDWPTDDDDREQMRNHYLWPGFTRNMFNLDTREGRLACIAQGRPNCLVADFARNTSTLGEINNPKIPTPRKKGDKPGDRPAKICETCLTFNHTSARNCIECGAEFPIQTKLTGEASDAALIAGNPATEGEGPVEEWFDVQKIEYSKHVPWNGKKRVKGRPVASLRVAYVCGLRIFHEYVCLEHDGHARLMASKWWKEASDVETPLTVDDALKVADTLRQPKQVRVWINRKNPQVQFRDFA